jgi:hypothetical protein
MKRKLFWIMKPVLIAIFLSSVFLSNSFAACMSGIN